ncbi:hypothetical protein ACIQMR_37970 [Streptomyces sp. NPDC091376]|uniref:hypothetical protein n=1 Tax=Streptomyces sp. NPDC091376 TaxID=3365994 RepID=UPI0037F659F6
MTGEAAPQVAAGEVPMVFARWLASLASESHDELRHREADVLAEHGVTIRYSWAPLVLFSGGLR